MLCCLILDGALPWGMFGLFVKKPVGHPCVKQDDPQTFRVRVKTARQGEVVEFWFTKSAHIGADDGGGYIFRKSVVAPHSLDRGEFFIRFDPKYRVTELGQEGVAFVPVAEWEE